eukprot:CAMPEP_0174894372 /NCGR_PEP_ID=MMETSP0167-20121228/9023_1 /TAXON_ID=38298 /ORGANISM="Rhodella maculata, Strain CCMP736" /LENGTH=79 /DNA_ID=CAMNT_0016133437 /DNA_START=158 /DNA_END=397 /DNA_ORIENTATION=-
MIREDAVESRYMVERHLYINLTDPTKATSKEVYQRLPSGFLTRRGVVLKCSASLKIFLLIDMLLLALWSTNCERQPNFD